MRRSLPIFALPLLASACAAPPEVQLLVPRVDAELRQPVTVEPREAVTLADVGLILTDHVQALDAANGRICAIDTTLTQFEARAGMPATTEGDDPCRDFRPAPTGRPARR
jgi:hypothetical protein